MTTQFTQRICFPLLVYNGGSYIQLLPRSVSLVDVTLGVTSHVFESPSDIYPKFSPPTPVDFNSYVENWAIQSIQAYFRSLGISDYYNRFIFEGMRYVANGNANSYVNANNAYVEGFLIVNNKINTDFDNLFSDLISQIASSAVSIATQIADSNTNLLSVITNLTNLNNNLGNINTSLNNLNIDIGDVDIQTDNLVTQLQNIYTILSSQNANQASISSAIQNKDNQTDIVDELRFIFTQTNNEKSYRTLDNKNNLSILKGYYSASSMSDDNNINRSSIRSILSNISSKLSVVNDSISNSDSTQLHNKFLARLLVLSGIVGTSTTRPLDFITNSNVNSSLLDISTKINNIETKLEQNLPFATLTDVTLNVDTVKKCVTQDIKENLEI